MGIFELRRKVMKKTIITVFAFMVIFGFAVSGAMAQTWTWADPASFSHTGTGKLIELAVDPTNDLLMYGIEMRTGGAVIVTIGLTVTGDTDSSWTRHRPLETSQWAFKGASMLSPILLWRHGPLQQYTPLPIQPRVPTDNTGTYQAHCSREEWQTFCPLRNCHRSTVYPRRESTS